MCGSTARRPSAVVPSPRLRGNARVRLAYLSVWAIPASPVGPGGRCAALPEHNRRPTLLDIQPRASFCGVRHTRWPRRDSPTVRGGGVFSAPPPSSPRRAPPPGPTAERAHRLTLALQREHRFTFEAGGPRRREVSPTTHRPTGQPPTTQPLTAQEPNGTQPNRSPPNVRIGSHSSASVNLCARWASRACGACDRPAGRSHRAGVNHPQRAWRADRERLGCEWPELAAVILRLTGRGRGWCRILFDDTADSPFVLHALRAGVDALSIPVFFPGRAALRRLDRLALTSPADLLSGRAARWRHAFTA